MKEDYNGITLEALSIDKVRKKLPFGFKLFDKQQAVNISIKREYRDEELETMPRKELHDQIERIGSL